MKSKVVDPIKDKEVIEQIRIYFTDISNYATQQQTRNNAKRNLLFFIIGVNFPFKPSELISLKWSDFLDSNYNIKQFFNYNEFKISINSSVKNEFFSYFSYCKKNSVQIDLDSNIFATRQSNTPTLEAFHSVLNKLVQNLNLSLNLSIDSLRKTFAYWQIQENKYDNLKLIQLQKILNHSNNDLQYTFNYAGIDIDTTNTYINDTAL